MKQLVLIVGLLSLMGCVTHYSHATKSNAEFDADYAACQHEANLATASMDVPDYDYRKTARVTTLTDECIAVKGWIAHYE